jgi:Family of unknown function (DUF6600)/FecR protein
MMSTAACQRSEDVMNTLRVVGRSSLVVLLATVVPTVQANSQSPEQKPSQPSGQYEIALDRADSSKDVPAHIAIVEGAATIEREGRVEKAEENILLLAGDRLRTERGRVEILFSDGSALDLDHNTRLDLMSDSLMRLLDGRVRLSIASTTSLLDYRVDAAPGSVSIKSAGDYRIALSFPQGGDQELDVTVFRGSAELSNPLGLTLVRAGTHAAVTARTAPSLPYVVNSAAWDEFDRWVETQRDARYGVESAKYLPEEVRSYGGAFDQYGTWGYQPAYGNVWYPTVPAGWYPYSYGRWSFAARFGWFWVGFNHGWGWPTHHYGRWGYGANRWYWIPGRYWAPAWVSWAYAPGYVSWCPLGFDNRPVVAFTHVNVRPYGPWSAWTVVPARSFGPTYPAPGRVVAADSIAPTTWAQFRQREIAPAAPAVAVPRAEPLRAPTVAYAVARGSQPGSTTGRPSQPIATTGSRAPSRIPGPRTDTRSAGESRSNLPLQSVPGTPQRVIPNASTASAFQRLDPAERQALPRNYSPLPRNYSPAPSTSPDRASASRVPGPDVPRVDPSQPDVERAQPRGQYSWPRRNDMPDPYNFSPEPRTFSRIPRPASPDSRPAMPAPDPSAGADRGPFRSRSFEPRPAAPPPSSGNAPRAEPRSSAAPPSSAPERSNPPARTAPPDGGGRGQAVRRGGG